MSAPSRRGRAASAMSATRLGEPDPSARDPRNQGRVPESLVALALGAGGPDAGIRICELLAQPLNHVAA
ncbi:unnamed protein product [Lampetra fluviatilis]